jgi:peptidoglycan pentaglycine glycine transferase (the first glycine)
VESRLCLALQMECLPQFDLDALVLWPGYKDIGVLTDEVRWNNELMCMGGHLLQSWRWGEFKQRQGWTVERLHGANNAGTWMAQVLFKTHGPFTIAYIPRGPVMSGDHELVFPNMLTAMDIACRRRRAVALVMEPSQRFQLHGTYKQNGLVRWIKPLQPTATLFMPVLDDESMLQRMHHKTRYHVRLAKRQGISVSGHRPNEVSIAAFHRLLTETSRRNGIHLLPISYFMDMCSALGDDAEVLLGARDGQVVAGAIMVRFGTEANYLFAASSTEHRGQGAGALLVFASAQWARERGCSYVDLGNVGNHGLRTFKTGFGGEIQEYLPPMERRYRPALAWLARRAILARSFVG